MIRLPRREPAKALIFKLTPTARDTFLGELLDLLWNTHEAGFLPVPITKLLNDWIAHAHFENDPRTQERLAAVREAQ